ncbi:MAG TPA: amidohydrolase family protein [Terriglobales bacterium]|nr:amidohydrolase family protein [Terriglobales bacterium]
MQKTRTVLLTLVAVAEFLLSASSPYVRGLQAPTSPVVEQGKFRLHKMEQPIGEETYQVVNDGDCLAVTMNFKFTDRGTEVPLTASFRGASDLTPEHFEIKGKTSRQSEIDEEVKVEPGKIRLRTREKWTLTPIPPEAFFTIAGYAPATMQMLLVRYWSTHGSPAELRTLPSGSVKVEARGQDTISINGQNKKLDRYTIKGLIWGRETLWMDKHHNLAAVVTTDAEFDHFEAVGDGYESALGEFVGRAGTDEMADLAAISKGISGSHAETLALVGATLIDGTGRAPISDSVIVIDKGRIVAVGPRSKVKIPDAATVIDAKGKAILPGLWDMHAHFEQVEWGPIYLAAGVTSVRDCGNEFEFITSVRDAIAQGHGLGPRILAAGIVDGSGPSSIGVQRVDTPEQARLWVDRYHQAGFQQMKIYSSVKLEEVRAVAEEAHRLGMTVTGHVPDGLNAFQVIEAGQDQINHIQYIAAIMHPPLPVGASRQEQMKAVIDFDINSTTAKNALAFLKDHHTVIDPTVALYEFLTATTAKPPASFEPGVNKVAPELAEQLTDVGPPTERSAMFDKMFDRDLEIIGALHRTGIPIVAGTDQTVPGYSLHREIELYVKAGFTPMEAIQAATIVPARVMKLDKEVGTVETGKRADLVILDGNPMEEIQNTRKVEYVITNGVMYNCAELWKSVGFKP